ncbi:GNAT family N-acetyltransferase [Velocimicrobium porci]|uniref:GNAT family N-acetyltransferase n=1 Tax=Velocimicrobium porci TaxID=2606634 RepID=A0A6L5XV73_9FIRM|nr:GNAT family N-acetyltransferase [Velocimicrobium porci]MSS62715.1 GNAT family N-acetyltransferase [Velocimicrobium porci]
MNANVDLTNVVLETDRLIIREWKEIDLEDFYEYAKVDGVGQMAGWKPHTSIQESKTILEMFIKEKHTFALEQKDNHKVIGSLGLEEISFSLNEEYDNFVGREIGYVLSKDYWGRGLMPEAVNRVIKFCFENEKYDYLMCSHSVVNNQSKRVIEKSGFRFVKENMRVTRNGDENIFLYYVLDNPTKMK